MNTLKNSCLLIATVLLQGCAGGFSGIGEDSFACSGIPGSTYCMSSRDVYEVTNGIDFKPDDVVVNDPQNSAFIESRTTSTVTSADEVLSNKTSAHAVTVTAPATPNTPAVSVHIPTAPSAVENSNEYSVPVPIRKPAKIMRIFITPWEDADNNLNMSGYVFAEIEKRKWSVGLETSTRSVPVVPRRVSSGKTTAAATAVKAVIGNVR